MATDDHYKIEHWTAATAEADYKNKPPVVITVNDRAATRQAIINRVRQNGIGFVERSDWQAHKNKPQYLENDWNYHRIAIHHAGRSFACGPAALQMPEIQDKHMAKDGVGDIAYHYAIDCLGNIYEGRDIRFKGGHMRLYNTGNIGIVLLENLTEPDEGDDRIAKFRSFMSAVGIGRPMEVPSGQRDALEKFIKVLREFFNISVLGGHKEFPNQKDDGKICPGRVGLTLVKQLRATFDLSAP